MSPQTLFSPVTPASVRSDGTTTETFVAHSTTGSAWGPMQHGGPVAALLTRAMDRVSTTTGSRISRVTVDILGPVPIAEVRVSARIVRPGRRITLVEATTETQGPDGAWRPVARGAAWRLATQPTTEVASRPDVTMPAPEGNGARGLSWMGFSDAWATAGFVDTVEWEIVDKGGPGRPTQAWLDLLVPLVEGEQTTPLERLMCVSDTVNGVGARLDPELFTFLNTELTVHLFDAPQPGHIGVSAENITGRDGIGMSTGTLHSLDGCLGQVTQNVLVERR